MGLFFRRSVIAGVFFVLAGCNGEGSGTGGNSSRGSEALIAIGLVVGVTALDALIDSQFASPIEADGELVTTRMFGGRNQFEPSNFWSYGVIAFPTGLNRRNAERYLLFCEAFIAGLDPIDFDTPRPNNQALTVWPVRDRVTDEIYTNDTCSKAAEGYDIVESRKIINFAVRRGRQLDDRRGPFLIATHPGADIRQNADETALLTFDLSDYDNPDEIDRAIRVWSSKLRSDPAKWNSIEEQSRSKKGMWRLYDTLGDSADDYLQIGG